LWAKFVKKISVSFLFWGQKIVKRQFSERGIFYHKFPFVKRKFCQLVKKITDLFEEGVARFMPTRYTFMSFFGKESQLT